MRLSDDEIHQLWLHYEAHQDDDSLDRLVRHYEPLVRFLSRRALSRAPGHQDAEDLMANARHGLLDAIRRFEPARGLKFETYASRRISGAIVDGQRRDDPLTRAARKQVSALRDAQATFWDSEARRPTTSELAEILECSEDQVRKLTLAQQTLTKELDVDAAPASAFDAPTDLALQSVAQEATGELARRLSRLSVRDQTFVVLYYVESRTLREIGRALGCSDSRCAQIRKEVVAALGRP